jgi:hypothetical protein
MVIADFGKGMGCEMVGLHQAKVGDVSPATRRYERDSEVFEVLNRSEVENHGNLSGSPLAFVPNIIF